MDESVKTLDLQSRPNLNQTPIGTSGQWSLERLLALTQDEVFSLWSESPAAPMKEMNGHYMGIVPSADNVGHQESLAAGGFWDEDSKTGYWLGKGFRPVTATTGEAYIRYRSTGGKVHRRFFAQTRIDASLLDGKPAYVVPHTTISAQPVDEVRKLEDFIYIAAATIEGSSYLGVTQPSTRLESMANRSDPLFSILIGPTDEWVGPDEADF